MKKGIILTIVLMVIAFTSVGMWGDISEAGPELKKFPLYMIPFIALFGFCNDLIKFFRWHLYLRKTGLNIPVKKSLAIFVSGLSMSATPGKIGFVIKAQMLKSLTGRTLLATSPVIIAELYMDMIALSFISIFGVGLLGSDLWIALVCCAVPLLVLIPGVTDRILILIGKIPPFSGKVTQLKAALDDMFSLFGPGVLCTALVISLIAWTSEGVALHLILKCMGFDLGIVDSTIIFGFATLVGALSMLPGGLVITEASLMGLLMNAGVPAPQAALAVIMGRVFTLWLAVLIGSISLFVNRSYLSQSVKEV
jgi:uncharacterized membrane protein YbhN (UPF0104 family)